MALSADWSLRAAFLRPADFCEVFCFVSQREPGGTMTATEIEIAQLRKQDVTAREGIPSLVITPEAGTVKGGRSRVVPLHEHLTPRAHELVGV